MDRAAAMLGRVLAVLPGTAAAVREHGRERLADYAAALLAPAGPGLQSRDDLLDEAGAEARRLLGPDAAQALVRALDVHPAVLTANHHGADFLAQSVQGTLLTALPALLGDASGRAVPVLACGAVPLGSFTFPRGVLLARRPAPGPEDDSRAWPAGLKVPLFPWKYRYTQVLAAPPLTREQLVRARSAAAGLFQAGSIGRAEARALDVILAEDYGHPAVLSLPCYSDQAAVLNSRLWGRLFRDPEAGNGSRLVYLELERLAARLLARDLADPRSLFHAVLLDPGLRGAVLESLDRAVGCWDLERLAGLAAGKGNGQGADALRGSGTAFFWGRDGKGRKVPLHLAREAGRTWLRGRGLGEEAVEVELAAESLVAALAAGRILPGLFAAYGCLALARGVRCLGGVYQADYLPTMRRGLAAALASVGDAERSRAVAAAPAGELAAGPEFLFSRFAEGSLYPAGPVEILAAGGLARAMVEQCGAMTLEEALRAGLAELYAEFTPLPERDQDWRAVAAPASGPGGPAILDIPA
ncbi:MAG: hypothetical protein AB1916_03275 [Thermodesulfobacteriota bacterium]